MLESLMLVQGEIIPPPVKGDITIKTSNSTTFTVTASHLGTGFTTEYSIDGSPLIPAGTSISIPAGDHVVTLKLNVTTGTFLNITAMKTVLTEVIDWEDFQLPNLQFVGCNRLVKVPDYLPVTITSMNRMFRECANFNHDISQWDTSKVENMREVFNGCTSFNQDISSWNVSQVTDITSFLQNCTSFNQDLSSVVFKSSVVRSNYDRGAAAWNAAYRPKFTG